MVDASQSYLHWANTETVLVILKRGPVPEVWVTAEVTARRRVFSRREQLLGGAQLPLDGLVWNVPDLLLNATRATDEPVRRIRAGDLIVETTLAAYEASNPDQPAWKVETAQLVTFGSRWRCVCGPLKG